MQGPVDGGKNTSDLFVIRRTIVLCAEPLLPKRENSGMQFPQKNA